VIPRIVFRSVPRTTSPQVETWWRGVVELTPGWEHITYRDPINPAKFPLTSPHWKRCTSGAQLAGLIRLEALYNHGGVWLDSDVELWRPLDSLLPLHGVAAWEDRNVVPDAVMGFEPEHPVLAGMIAEALRMLGHGAWESGPGVSTRNLVGRDDVLLLPPGSFYPVHWQDKTPHDAEVLRAEQPWAFGWHHYAASWPGSYQG